MPANSTTVTAGIRIDAAASYLPQESQPGNRRHVYAYRITMTNVGTAGDGDGSAVEGGSVRLLSRHWIIVDSEGRREEVRGRGVVGEYPRLAVGESYSYISYCPLATTWGTMEGSYTFAREDGSKVQADVDRFFLVPTAPPLQLEAQKSS
ncbi:MAG: Co2+/Mg2+ efflux protein ApaG [Planctomycetes bacterium]|nr:Co2+/Mg2+ efflux protein ApaG [Planctomycetota bacterium]